MLPLECLDCFKSEHYFNICLFFLLPIEEEHVKKPKSKAEVCGYPVSIFIIVINEFCERFSYYGMRAVLVLYFKYFLRWDDDTATAIYHSFVAVCYLTPIFGAIIADSWLGKFKTIFSLSVVYTIGQAVMAVSSIHDLTDSNKDGTPDSLTIHVALSMIGLLLIAIGTGGIKPCVSAFGGDQFEDHQEKQRSRFFSIFYLSINAGSLLSTVITPILRGQECGINTQQKCYPLAFGVPAALMLVALLVFLAGSGLYKKVSPQGNVMLKVTKCIGFALKNRWRHRSKQFPKREHWMDWADEKYDKRLISQIKMVLKVLFLYIPLPMFWALFDQQGSRWTLQATTMDGNFGLMTIQPDQMQTVNPILIIVLVPVVDGLLYPLIAKCKLNFTPLKRMTVGMLLAASAFVVAAVVQIQIDATLPNFPEPGQSQLKFINLGNEAVTAKWTDKSLTLDKWTNSPYEDSKSEQIRLSVQYGQKPNNYSIDLQSGTRQTLLLTNSPVSIYMLKDIGEKPEQGSNAIRFVNGFNQPVKISVGGTDLGNVNFLSSTNYTLVGEGTSNFNFSSNGFFCNSSKTFGFGSSYTIVIKEMCTENTNLNLMYVEDIQANTIHMAWQIPQYFLMTSGEVVFSVTGLEFSYSQAPSNMKSVLQAGWLLTVAVGNIIVLIVAEAGEFPKQWAEYILFAALLLAVSVLFAVMAYFYTYVDPVQIEAQFDDEEQKKNHIYENGVNACEMEEGLKAHEDKQNDVKQTKI
ncbi:solute carrier family 15 member 1-like isoform X1 [Polypterus senegalus]|uniref:solute carrier family 15 member 1-like isoform X1 n=1 Tax=Polypterus senegalus TaxID=55291 RepID=UPI0019666A59|nr:solute carrier family 15 member 1-like isoform X1 [Polypterus senegalus]